MQKQMNEVHLTMRILEREKIPLLRMKRSSTLHFDKFKYPASYTNILFLSTRQ